MTRKASFTDDSVFAAVGAELLEAGSLTVEGLKSRTGLSIGSIYHRFGSREGLMAATWLASVAEFQGYFLPAITAADLESGVEAALATPRFCREQPAFATVLACCRRSEFTGPRTPPEVRAQVDNANGDASVALRAFAARVNRSPLACRLAIVDFPVAAVRACLPGAVPASVDDIVARTYAAALEMPRPARE